MSKGEFDPHITSDCIAHPKDADYSIKELTLDHLNATLVTPLKALAGREVTEAVIQSIGTSIRG